MLNRSTIKRVWTLVPIWGIILFTILYVVATFYYPGGSQFHPNSAGFSWTENYWCNLLNETALNGQPNPAQPIALTAMLLLCITLTSFWWQFPQFTNFTNGYKLTIQLCGTLAMVVGSLLFTKLDHDLITNLASLFGMIATTGTIIGLYRNGWKTLFCFGLINVLFVVANNVLYYRSCLNFIKNPQS